MLVYCSTRHTMRAAFCSLLLAAAVGSHAHASISAHENLKRQDSEATPTSVFVPPTAAPAPNVNSSQYDLTQHFCRLWRHASVYADGKIYIDGGETYVPKNNGTFDTTPELEWTKGINNHVLVLDLSRSFNDTDTFPYSTIRKGPDVPSSLMEHALWYSQTKRIIYQIGGWWSVSNVQDPGYKDLQKIPEAEIWEFGLDSKTWTKTTDLTLVNFKAKVQRPGAAAYCDAPAINQSFIFQGYSEQRSEKDYTDYEQWSEYKFIEGLVSLDTSSDAKQPTLTNISAPLQMGGVDFGPRMNGAMVHVPVGKRGVLIQIGGQITVNKTPYGVRIPGASGGNHNIGLTFVDIYDIESGFWFRQETSALYDGFPIGRSDICAVVVPANDSSSYQIYMVSGMDDYNKHITLGEIWVLSVPSFKWFLMHTIPEGFYGHSCHVVGENLVQIGGMETTSSGDISTCAPHMPATVYSLVTQNYTGRFDAAGAKRLAPVPSKVIRAIGGTSLGGAAITVPVVWSDLYLQYVFNPTLPRPSYSPSYVLADPPESKSNSTSPVPIPPPDGGNDNKSAVIGGVVGGILGALVLGAATFFFARRRKRSKATDSVLPEELPATAMYRNATYGKPEYEFGASPIFKQAAPAELTAGTRSELGTYHVSELEVPDQGIYSPAPTFSTVATSEGWTPMSKYASPVSPEDIQIARDSPLTRLANLSEEVRRGENR